MVSWYGGKWPAGYALLQRGLYLLLLGLEARDVRLELTHRRG